MSTAKPLHLFELEDTESEAQRRVVRDTEMTRVKQMHTYGGTVSGRADVLRRVVPAAALLRPPSLVAWHLACVWLCYQSTAYSWGSVGYRRTNAVPCVDALYVRLLQEPHASAAYRCLVEQRH